MAEFRLERLGGGAEVFTDGDTYFGKERAVKLLNAQSAEIAGLRDLLKGVIEFADSGDFDGAISLALYRRIQSAIGVELPNPSEIPNSSEVSDAAEGG